jgi:sugar/nucleoside kinase (ribokinase family)
LTFDLVGIGNPVYDTIITPWNRTEGRVLSGCSTNACLAARKLGMNKVGLVGTVGSDYAERFEQDMKNYGIDAFIDKSGKETGGFRLVYDEKGNRTLDVLGVASKITTETFPDAFLNSKFFLIGPILGEVDVELVELIHSSSSGRIFLDPQGLIRIIGNDRRIIHKCNWNEFAKIARLVDFIKPNEQESETITGETDHEIALRQLGKLGKGLPIVTLADRGSIVLEDNRIHSIPAFATQAVDPTGAGDVYGGSFITEYQRTGSIIESALYASAAASLKVEQVGPDFLLAEENVRKRKETLRDKVVTEHADL